MVRDAIGFALRASPTAPGLAMTSATCGLREFAETRAKRAATIEKEQKAPKSRNIPARN
jgi:hypothetical protein